MFNSQRIVVHLLLIGMVCLQVKLITTESSDVEPNFTPDLSTPSTSTEASKEPQSNEQVNSNSNSIPPEEPVVSIDSNPIDSNSNQPQPVNLPPPPPPVVDRPPYSEVNWPSKNNNEKKSIDQDDAIESIREQQEPVKQADDEPRKSETIDSFQIQVRPALKPVYQSKQDAMSAIRTAETINRQQSIWPNAINSNKQPFDWTESANLPQGSNSKLILREPQPTYEAFPPKPIQWYQPKQQGQQKPLAIVDGPQLRIHSSSKVDRLSSSSSSSSCINSICPKANGYFPHPLDCCSFIICTECQAYLMRCAANTQYNPFQRTCTYPYQSQCSAPNKDCHATSKAFGAGNIKA